jgi:release factor glutamine methyltransferase
LKHDKQNFKAALIHLYTHDEIEILFKMILESIFNQTHLSNLNNELNLSQIKLFENYTQKLIQQIPIQYILGEAHFYGLKFKVNESVLIPRSETEELVQLVIKHAKNKVLEILEIGTGSGCIPIAIKRNSPQSKVFSIDISKKAIELAKENALLNRVEVVFVEDDALKLKSSKYILYDVIVSNPPYISMSEMKQMDKQVTDNEPHLALFVDDENTLIFYDKISDFALTNLKKDGFLFFEINQALAKETEKLISKKGFKVEVLKDINANDRMLVAQLLG